MKNGLAFWFIRHSNEYLFSFASRGLPLPLHGHQVVVVAQVVDGRGHVVVVVVVYAIRFVGYESAADGSAIRRMTRRTELASRTSIFAEIFPNYWSLFEQLIWHQCKHICLVWVLERCLGRVIHGYGWLV